jgi:hypothetical protein
MDWDISTQSRFGSEYGDQWLDGTRGYYNHDYDWIVDSILETTGSTWSGNNRAALIRMSHSRHVTSSRDVLSVGTGDYLPYNYALGLFSDSMGAPSVIGKLIVWNECGYSNCIDYQDDADPTLVRLRQTIDHPHAAYKLRHEELAKKIEKQQLILS